MRLITLAVLFAVLAIGAFAQSGLKTGNAAPVFAAPMLDGGFVDLASLRGNLVVITFWSTKCEICRNEIPHLNAFKKRHEGENVTFLALTMENETRINPFLRSNRFEFSIIPDSFGIVLQYADRDRQGNIDMGFPSYFLIDGSGNLAYRASGWDKTNELESKMVQLLSLK